MIKRIMIWIMWYPLRRLINRLPLSIVYAAGVLGGTLLYYISKDKQELISQELSLIFPDTKRGKIKKIARESVINFVLSELEVLFYPSMDEAFVKRLVEIEGRHHLDDALAEGKGVLLFQAHFGAFQMVMPAIGYRGYKMNQISAPASVWKDDAQSSLQQKSYDIKAGYEYTLPVRHIDLKTNLKAVFSALKRNEIVGVTADGGGGKKVVSIPFLGRKACFQQGSVDLAIRTGASMIPVFILTLKNFKHRLIIHPPIKLHTAGSKEEQIFQALQKYTEILEHYVRRFPSHYGFNLFLRRSRAHKDDFFFFQDYFDHSAHPSRKMRKL